MKYSLTDQNNQEVEVTETLDEAIEIMMYWRLDGVKLRIESINQGE